MSGGGPWPNNSMEKGGCGRYGDGSFMVHGSSDEDFFLEGSDEPDRQLAHMRMGKSEMVTPKAGSHGYAISGLNCGVSIAAQDSL
ncbi:hypothetical protein SCLCIDRAFT_1207642 [Scleroderma citrinum Foug A]|uniref:Uncharacterized protein n=1 Tax=Scleroderma citrinum Foug A TaxID=1036808 RepID=A0A0C3EC95_9AGAM|nr:hypothetical protein SCLCIDRAFT_1207642 [Scleroderma citrinum Foug A]